MIDSVSLARPLDVRIDGERPADTFARENLLDEAFGPARFRKTCECFRAGRMPARGLALVARDGARLVGTVRLWHVRAGGVSALMLGPLAVAKSHRGLGIGDALMREALARAKAQDHRAVILVGDAPYYAKFGFSRALAEGLELVPGALAPAKGRVIATGEKVRRLTSPRVRGEVDRRIAAGG